MPAEGRLLPPVLLLGFGKMGSAMAAGWAEQGLTPSYAIDPAGTGTPSITCVPDIADVPPDFQPACVLLAVKPQMAPDSVPPLARYTGSAVFLSIMAGCRLATLANWLGSKAAIVRAMPNTPAAIRQAITVACAATNVAPAQRTLCHSLLTAIGVVEWTDSESDLDAVTAVSGGGPAYLFLLTELLEQAAVAQGLAPALARTLARHTMSGAGALLAATDTDAATLRRAVTSPKGTTERALAILTDAWPKAIHQAIQAATERSRELSG